MPKANRNDKPMMNCNTFADAHAHAQAKKTRWLRARYQERGGRRNPAQHKALIIQDSELSLAFLGDMIPLAHSLCMYLVLAHLGAAVAKTTHIGNQERPLLPVDFEFVSHSRGFCEGFGHKTVSPSH